MGHPVVTANAYTKWFSRGDVPIDHLRRFAIEFSVFSNQFLLAALNRVINADTLHAARKSKEILMTSSVSSTTKAATTHQPGLMHREPRD